MVKSTKTWAKYPDSISINYYRQIKPITDRLKRLYNEMIEPELSELLKMQYVETPQDQRVSNDISLTGTIAALFVRFREKFFGQTYNENQDPKTTAFRRKTESEVEKAAKAIAALHKSRFGANAKSSGGTDNLRGEPWLRDYLSDWTMQNVSLIKDIPIDTINNLEKTITASVLRGDSKLFLQDTVRNIMKTSETRARLIARDQTNKLYGTLTELRANNNGWDFYEWSTSNDSRVRSKSNSNGYSDHKRLEGKIFKFSEPPVTVFKGKRSGEKNNPGQDIQCRCVPLVVFDQEMINNLKKQADGSYAVRKAA